MELTELKRTELLKIAKALGLKTNLKMKNSELVKIIQDLNLDKFELADIITTMTKKPSYIESANEVEEVAPIKTVRERTYDEAIRDGKRTFNDIAAKAKKRALEKVMVYITPNSEIDLAAGANCVTLFVHNQAGVNIAKAVPFNIWCEVERCLAEQAKEIIMNKYQETTSNGKQMGSVYKIPKYNVQIQEVDTFKRNKGIPLNYHA